MIKNFQNIYFNRITHVLKQARPRLAVTHQLEFKNCFGAIAGYVDGCMFISCGKFGLALRLPPGDREDLFKEKGVKPLKYFPNGHIKKEYAVLPQAIIKNDQRVKNLINKSIRFVLLSLS